MKIGGSSAAPNDRQVQTHPRPFQRDAGFEASASSFYAGDIIFFL